MAEDHLFVQHTYKSPTWCDECKDFIWGFVLQGYQCKVCGFNAHSRCRKRVRTECGMRKKFDKSEVVRINGHEFQSYTYSSPTWCNNCNNFIWGFQKQGWKCNLCGVNAHGRCLNSFDVPCFISHVAGVNIIQREETLSSLREHRIIMASDQFTIEDGFFGGVSHSFFDNLSEKSRISSDSSLNLIQTVNEEHVPLFRNPDQDTWFATSFVGSGYELFIVQTNEPFFLTLTQASNDENEPIIQAILWMPTGKEHVVIPGSKIVGSSIAYDILENYEEFQGNKKFAVSKVLANTRLHKAIEKHLISVEAAQCTTDFTISVLYQKAGQRDEQSIIGNDTIDKSFENFLEILGTKIELQGWNQFNGGLDTIEGKQGKESYFTQFCGNNLMFHIGPLIPREGSQATSLLEAIEAQNEPDFRALSDRSGLIKNNAVCIVFMENKLCRFQPTSITSKYIHNYVCIQPQTDKDFGYFLNVASSVHTPQFGPNLPNPPVFEKRDSFRNFLLAKVVNATKASFVTPAFIAKRKRAVATLLLEYEDSLNSMSFSVKKQVH